MIAPSAAASPSKKASVKALRSRIAARPARVSILVTGEEINDRGVEGCAGRMDALPGSGEISVGPAGSGRPSTPQPHPTHAVITSLLEDQRRSFSSRKDVFDQVDLVDLLPKIGGNRQRFIIG